MKTRIEKDSMGQLDVPAQALYGAQTQRAINNFPISGQRLPAAFIHSLLLAKRRRPKPMSGSNRFHLTWVRQS